MKPLRRLVVVLLWLVALPVLGLAVVRALPHDGTFPLAQAVGFVPWAALVTVPLIAIALAARRSFLAFLLIVAVGFFGFWMSAFWLPSTSAVPVLDPDDPGTLRVMTVNALYGRVDAEAVVDAVRDENVEVLAVQELTPGLVDALFDAGLDDVLPHSTTHRLDEPAAGSGLWSAVELRDVDEGPDSGFAMPSALVDAGGTDVRVTVVHPVPPLLSTTGRWHDELAVLADRVHADGTPQVLAGDFNATFDHPSFRAVLGDRFQDASRAWGTGTAFTWPADRQIPPVLALDHVVVENDMRVSDVVAVTLPGTDHRAVVATVAVP
ncbi:endonuclease/exonuclease/phosphatase family protein [Antribacter gilvus]|uniref:endonuclease/exonuclease/phosphatase family protein n=1 Tax=Antribacter gilvus TaxID=2304675 RepID=UPI000F7AEDB6|nr:endonuclease/exonuclease/phosphatase family protein [Antribacter gilvus]